MNERSDASLRREIKMLAGPHAMPDVRAWVRLHPAAFQELHPARHINNAYFDTPHLESLEACFAGIAVKRKLRLRWYGDVARGVRAIIQVKGKAGVSGWKLEHPLRDPVDIEGASWSALAAAIRPELTGEVRLEFDRRPEPIFINRYRREYYISMDGRVRLTLDGDQTVFDQRQASVVNLRQPAVVLRNAIVELKALPGDDRLAEVSSSLPLRFEAVSKYVMAVDALLAG